MIAVVSSTIFPPRSAGHDGARSCFSDDERLEQTRGSVDSLLARGAREVIVVDNSGARWRAGAEADLAPARVLRPDTPQFRNKGLGELHLLRWALAYLPDDEPVVKLSGRYRVTERTIADCRPHDVAGRAYVQYRKTWFSTRCYVVRDRATFARLLDRAAREMYADAARIRGPRSLMRIVRGSLRPDADAFPYDDPPVALEAAFGAAIARERLDTRLVDSLGVEGYAGAAAGLFITE